MVVQTGKIEIEASLWYPSAMLVMPVINMPCDNRCGHCGARCCAGYRCAHCCTRHRHAHHYALSYVLVVALSIVLYRRVSSCIVVHTAVFAVVATGNLRTVISSIVEGSNVGIHGGGGGDKGADSLWVPGLTTVEVDRSVKVRRDSRKRSQPILANIGHFLLPLERVRCNWEYTVACKIGFLLPTCT